MDHIRHPPTLKDPVQQAIEVPELQQLPIVPLQTKPFVLEQPLHQVLPMPRPVPLHDTIPKVPDQSVSF